MASNPIANSVTPYIDVTDNDLPTDAKGIRILDLEVEIYLARLIFIVFAFLFVIVVMNLLNAIAIGDVQVSTWISNQYCTAKRCAKNNFCLIK